MVRLPPSRHTLHCGLRIPDLRTRDDSPLRRSCHHVGPASCRTRRLRAQRIRRCGLNATFRTRLQRCDGDWWPLSLRHSRVAHAAPLGTNTEICDTVRLRQYENAIREYGQVLEFDARSALAHYNRGTAYDGNIRYHEAITDYN